ncbi:MAG: hypothetical protein OHK0037_28210 [Elainellaceae cyanobacterium]
MDILVAFDPDQKTFDNFIHLSFFLEDLFGRAVDLITVESLSPYIGPHILDEVEYLELETTEKSLYSYIQSVHSYSSCEQRYKFESSFQSCWSLAYRIFP